MTTEERKKHQRAICEALIDGKQCQTKFDGIWYDQDASNIAENLFDADGSFEIRIKPEPRRCWVKWDRYGPGYEDCCPHITNCEPTEPGWQLVPEDVK